MTVKLLRCAAVTLLALGCVALERAAVADPVRGDTAANGEPGIWQEHEVDLAYMGFTSTYSCDGLQSKLELLLRRLGARADAKVTTSGCARGFGTPSRFAAAKLKFATLAPAASDASASTSASASASASAPVLGVWRQVQLAPRRPYELDDGDCELIEQFRDKVLPLFLTREVKQQITCVPHQDTGGPFSLQLQVFAQPAHTASK
jgi:hypothetical protein